MPLDPYLAKALLDWTTGAAAVSQPAARFLGFESGSPTTAADSAAPVFRQRVTFQTASTIAGASASASLAAAVTCTATAVSTIRGWALYNSTSGGTRLMYGSITALQTLLSGSGIAFTAPNLAITLA